MKGVQFVMNDRGEKTAVLIDLQKHGDIWEDFWDVATAEGRKKEPRESLEAVKKRIAGNGKS
jgi:hypothetical protein